MKKEEINDQFILNYFYTTPESTKINGHKTQNIPNNIQEYLNNRFEDSESNKETIMRIKYGIEKRPLCPVCNKPVRWYGHKATRLFFNTCCHEHEVLVRKQNIKKAVYEKYGVDNVFQLEDVKEKSRQTCFLHYGVEHSTQSDIVKEKSQMTCYKKYGVKNAGGTTESIRKAKQTYLEHFGVENPMYTDEIKNKIKECCMHKYGVEWGSQTQLSRQKCSNTWKNKLKSEIDEIVEKRKNTNLLKYGETDPNKNEYIKLKKIYRSLEKYGYENPNQRPEHIEKLKAIWQNDEIKKKQIETKIKNNSFYKSQPEEDIYIILKQVFGENNIKRQYRSAVYPFNCDFYIIPLDLYIEFQGTWTHGKHPFEENRQEDIDKLNLWLSKNTNYYNEAIYTWTIRDPLKREIAKRNNLNYLEFWNIIDIKEFIKQYEES